MPYCSNCGALVYDTAKHCYRCGAALAAFGEPNESAAIKLPLDPNARRLTRAQKWRVAILAALVVLVVALIAQGYYFHFQI